MKKLVSFLAAVCVAISVSVTAFAEGHVFIADNADFFTNSEEDKLFEKANEVADDSDWCIMIITEEGYFSESDARSELKQWYKDEFGSSEKGAAYIMTSETGKAEGDNDYALVIETFGGATISENRTYNQAEDAFLDYDEYGSAVAFLSACGKTSSNASNSGSASTSSSSSDEKTSPIVYIITFVIVGGAIVIGVIKRILVRKALGSVGINTNSYNRRDRYRNRNYGSNRSSGRSSGSSRSSGGRTGKR